MKRANEAVVRYGLSRLLGRLLDVRTTFVAADQPHQLLRMHVMAMGIENVLP